VAVVCHPHPMYGGSMHKQRRRGDSRGDVASRIRDVALQLSRVGGSEGEHDGGPGEVDDALAAMSYLLTQPGVRKEGAAMTGYSFGAMVALSAGYERAEIARIVAVALPLAMAEARVPDGASKPVLLVSGNRDSYSPVAGLQALASRIGGLGAIGNHRGRRSLFRRPRIRTVTRDRPQR